jgi:hypothetical protein
MILYQVPLRDYHPFPSCCSTLYSIAAAVTLAVGVTTAAAAAARLACPSLSASCSGARPNIAHCLQHLLLSQLFSCLRLPHRCHHCSLYLHSIHAFSPQLLPLIPTRCAGSCALGTSARNWLIIYILLPSPPKDIIRGGDIYFMCGNMISCRSQRKIGACQSVSPGRTQRKPSLYTLAQMCCSDSDFIWYGGEVSRCHAMAPSKYEVPSWSVVWTNFHCSLVTSYPLFLD